MPDAARVTVARASTPGQPTLSEFVVATYNAGVDSDKYFVQVEDATSHMRALETFSDRLAILLSRCHVVGVNEISPQQLNNVIRYLPNIGSKSLGHHDAVLWHPLHVWGCGCGVD